MPTGHRSLLRAVREGDLSMVQELLGSGGGTKLGVRDNQGCTPLHVAAAGGHVGCLQALLAAGADISARDIVERFQPVHLAAQHGQQECLRALLEAGAEVEAHSCCDSCKGYTPLILAAEHGQLECLEFLLSWGADPRVEGVFDMPPAHWAASNGHASCLSALLAAGVDPNIPGGGVKGALRSTPLQLAASQGHVACVEALVAAGADLQAVVDRAENALHVAAYAGHAACVQALLKAGAACDAENIDGHTALVMAAFKGHSDCVPPLLAAGADPNSVDHATNLNPLALLASAGPRALPPSVLLALLYAGADLELPHSAAAPVSLLDLLLGRVSPLDHIPEHTPDVVRLLLEAGCPADRPGQTPEGSPLSTTTRWLSSITHEVQELPRPWAESPLSTATLGIAAELLRSAAAERPAGRPSFLFNAIASGSLPLVRLVLEAFPQVAPRWWQGKARIGAVQAAVRWLARELQQAPRPPLSLQASWEAAQAAPAVNFYHLATALLEAGCEPLPGEVAVQEAEEAGLPPWAIEPLRALLVLAAEGREWSPERHKLYPASFRRAARTVLLIDCCRGFGLPAAAAEAAAGAGGMRDPCAAAPAEENPRGAGRQDPRGSTQLPPGVLLHILGLASQPLPAWMPQLHRYV